jgi:hypothetical protein
MACVGLGDVLANGLGNLTAGRAWFARATRLVEDLPPCVEQGWVAVAALGCVVDDPAELLARAELALDRARRFGDLNLETKALADAGLAHVQAGRVIEGMTLLDEAMALACGPADDRDSTGKSVCSFFTACYYAADFRRAATWADLLRRQGLIAVDAPEPAFVSSHCDSVQATLLMELGRWSEAEQLLLRAKADFEAALGTTTSWHPDIALADLRTRQGRFDDAELLLLGKDGALDALLPAARLHAARGDHELALAAARRGLATLGADRLRAVELLRVCVDAHLGLGDLEAARAASSELDARLADLDIPALRARADLARARVLAASGEPERAAAVVDGAIDALDTSGAADLPWLRAMLLVELARFRDAAGQPGPAAAAARTARAALDQLDVGLGRRDTILLGRLTGGGATANGVATATLAAGPDGWWSASFAGTTARLRDTKGLRYVAELVAAPGVERHVLDLVDRVEGVGVDGDPDRRRLGDAGELLDDRARQAYRHRIEALRADIDDALAEQRLEAAEQLQAELDQLVGELARAFGLGGRSRPAAAAAERARLNVTRAVRAALGKLSEALPDAGAALDRHVRTGTYCVYQPAAGEIGWIVQSRVNGSRAG